MTHTPLELPAQLDLEQFISDEAHDLRSPFNQIVGFSKILLSGPNPNYPPELQREDAGAIYRGGQRALLLMNSLIDAARLNRHEKEMDAADVEVKLLLESSLAYWKRLNPASTLQLEHQISTSASHLSADETLLRQSLASFIMVVAQYINPDGKVTLTVGEEPAWFVFTVTGAGTKTQPVSQLDLGLQGYIGRAMVEVQHGEIRLAEETDDGASIQFALPKV